MKRLWLVALAATLALTFLLQRRGDESSVRQLKLHPAPRRLPEIAIGDGQGKIGALADFRSKVVLLNVWATWCFPCRKEMPTLDRLQAQLGGRDFEVVALSIDRGGVDSVRRFYAALGVQFLSVRIDPSGEAPSTLGAYGVPLTLLVDRDGQEIGRLIGSAKWDAPKMIDFLKARSAQ